MCRLNERLFQPHRIGDDHGDQKVIAVPRQVLHHGGVVAERGPIAAQIRTLQMCRRDGQRVSVPLPGGKSRPGMRRILGRMRAAIHINRALQRPQIFEMIRGDLARYRIHLRRDAHRAQCAPLIRSWMRPALELREAPFRMVVTVGLHSTRIVERNTLIIAQRRTARTFVIVLGDSIRPGCPKDRFERTAERSRASPRAANAAVEYTYQSRKLGYTAAGRPCDNQGMSGMSKAVAAVTALARVLVSLGCVLSCWTVTASVPPRHKQHTNSCAPLLQTAETPRAPMATAAVPLAVAAARGPQISFALESSFQPVLHRPPSPALPPPPVLRV